MSTKIKTILALSLALLASIFIFSACNSEQHVHQYGEWTVTRAATCVESGEEARYCSCGDTQTRALPIKEHSYGEWVVVKVATCTEDGSQESSCVCGNKLTQIIAATGHAYGEWTALKMPTCTEGGSEERYCACGDKQAQGTSAAGHSYGEWAVSKEATCTEVGEKYSICSACSDKKTEIIPSGHNWIDATCTTPKTCSKCKATDGVKLGHTCKTGTCERCNEYISVEIKLPATPITVSYGDNTKMKITSLSYEFDEIGRLLLYFNAEKTYDKDGKASSRRVAFNYAIKDSDGYVVKTGIWLGDGYFVGDKFKSSEDYISGLDLKSDYYTLEIYDYD